MRAKGARLKYHSEKSELTEEANRIIKTIRLMEASLEDDKLVNSYKLEDKELKVTVPLQSCLQGLKEKHNVIAKLHRERFEQVKSTLLGSPVANLRLMSYRARPGPRVLFVSSRTLVCTNQASAND